MVLRFFLDFAFYYPLTMAWFWIFGALNYYLRRERTGPARPSAGTAPLAQGHAGCALPQRRR